MKRPPRIARWILSITNRKSNREIVLGDFEEEYSDKLRQRGTFIASIWFYAEAFKSIPKFIKMNIYWGGVMLANYFKFAVRNFSKQKVFTLINILGLSTALACTLLFYLFVQDEFSYDKFHRNADNIYSVINTDNYFNYNYRHVPNGVGPALKEFFPEIKEQVRISREHAVLKYGNNAFQEDITLVDENFFNMFSFDLLYGNRRNILSNENSIVLTESAASKYFGTVSVVGKYISADFGDLSKEFMVTGVAKDVPSNSTIQFEFLVNINNLAFTRGPDVLNSWTWPRSQTYILLQNNFNAELLQNRMDQFVHQYMGGVIDERKNRGSWLDEGPTIQFWMQNMKDIYLKSQFASGNEFSDINNSIILSAIGFLVLLIAGINFVNISIGRASSRAMEVGIRKVLGAEKRSLIIQHWIESIIMVTLSMAAGLVLTILLLSLFNNISGKHLTVENILTFQNTWIILSSIVIIGIISGSFPGLVLSGFKPVEILKGKLKIGGNNLITKTLIVIQFSVSIFLIISTITMNKQLEFINSSDLGFNKEGIVTLETQGRDYENNDRIYNLLKNKSESYNDIISISGCVLPFSTAEGEGMLEMNDKKVHFNFNAIHYDFIETMGMSLVEGRDFSQENISDAEAIVVNEEFVKQFELENPIGHLTPDGSKIIGVVKNYNYRSLQHKIEPVIHWIDKRTGPRILLIRISTEDISSTLSNLENLWDEIAPDIPFNYSFFDEDLAKRYSKEQKWNSIAFYSSFLAILITCMGLIGMTSIITSRRMKEIGIRKVFGASAGQISQNILNKFLILISISYVITFPIGFYLMNKWLENFAYRTAIGFDIFLTAGIISLAVTLFTISYQVLKAAKSNPVETLKYE